MKPLRHTEKLYNLGLWIVAFVFSFCLIALASSLTSDLPNNQNWSSIPITDYVDAKAKLLEIKIKENNTTLSELEETLIPQATTQYNQLLEINHLKAREFSDFIQARDGYQLPVITPRAHQQEPIYLPISLMNDNSDSEGKGTDINGPIEENPLAEPKDSNSSEFKIRYNNSALIPSPSNIKQSNPYDTPIAKKSINLESQYQELYNALTQLHRLQNESNVLFNQQQDIYKQYKPYYDQAQTRIQHLIFQSELRVFLIRFLCTFPLLLIAGYLFAKQRHTTRWPYIYGFGFFALYENLVEMVPYFPETAQYIRYTIALILTVVIGSFLIKTWKKYLDRLALTEKEPIIDRQERIHLEEDYAKNIASLDRSICPGCDRAIDFGHSDVFFCPHCGLNVKRHCIQCNNVINSFSKFCKTCGCPRPTLPITAILESTIPPESDSPKNP